MFLMFHHPALLVARCAESWQRPVFSAALSPGLGNAGPHSVRSRRNAERPTTWHMECTVLRVTRTPFPRDEFDQARPTTRMRGSCQLRHTTTQWRCPHHGRRPTPWLLPRMVIAAKRSCSRTPSMRVSSTQAACFKATGRIGFSTAAPWTVFDEPHPTSYT